MSFIRTTIKPGTPCFLLEWAGGNPPFQVWRSDSPATAPKWYKSGAPTVERQSLQADIGIASIFRVEDNVPVGKVVPVPGSLVADADGLLPADILIENPSNVVTLTNSGYVVCYAEACHNLLGLNVTGNQISDLRLTGTPLRQLKCAANKLTSIELPDTIQVLECGNNPLTSLPLKGKTKLVSLACEECQITELDLTDLVNLQNLVPYTNPIKRLDISTCPKLMHIDIGDTMTFEQDSFDQMLVQLDAFGLHNGTFECYGLRPSGAGLTAEANLKTKGWKISYQ